MKLKVELPQLYFLISLSLLLLLYVLRSSQLLQLTIVVIATFLYMLFSLIHHHMDHSLTTMTVLEYILIASLVLVILSGVITI